MIYILENLIPILAATGAAFLFGGAWFGVFSGVWASVMDGDRGARRPGTYAVVFIAEFWMCSILAGALILASAEAGAWTMALGSAFIIWVGFVLPAVLVNHRIAGRPLKLTLIETGHWLGAMLVMASVMQLIGVSGPTG